MYNFTDVVKTSRKSPGANTCQYIIIHHTGGGTYASNLRLLSGDGPGVSVQFIVGTKGECAKIGNPTDILWHAGESQWGKYEGMNHYSMGIETVGPDKNGKFSDLQYARLVDLIKYLMKTFNIPVENVLKHADLTRAGSHDMKLRDGHSPSRKTDIYRSLRADRGFASFDDRRRKVLK